MASKATALSASVILQALCAGGWLSILFMTLGLIASEFSCANLEFLGASLGINDSTMGVTFLALGNALPDLFSTFRAIETGSGNLGIGELLGAAVFLVTVVGGGIMIVRPFRVHPATFFRDNGLFFLTSLTMLMCMYSGKVTLGACALLIALFFTFIGLIFLMRGYESTHELEPLLASNHCDVEAPMITGHQSLLAAVDLSELADDMEQCEQQSERQAGTSENPNHVCTHNRAIIDASLATEAAPLTEPQQPSTSHVILHALFPSLCGWSLHSVIGKIICITSTPPFFLLRATVPAPAGVSERVEHISRWKDHTISAELAEKRLLTCMHGILTPAFAIWATGINISGISQWALMVLASILGFVFRGVLNHTVPRGLIGFVASALWIYVTVGEVVHMLRVVGDLVGLSDTLLGLTVFTFGNSLGDVVTNIAVARMGHPLMSFSACFASPMVNMLLGVGLSCALVQIGQPGPYVMDFHPSLLLSCTILLGTLALYLVVVPMCKYVVGRPLGILLNGIYVAAITTAVAIEITNT